MRKYVWLSLFLTWLWLPVLPAAEVPATMISLEGEERAVQLQDISARGLRCAQGDVPLSALAEVVFGPEDPVAPAKTVLVLRNGDQLHADVRSGDDSKLTVVSEACGEVTFENKFLDAILFPAAKNAPPADALAAFLKAAPPKEDLLWLAKGDTVSGFLERFADGEVKFNAGGQSRSYRFEQLSAFRLAPLEAYQPGAGLRAVLTLRDGGRLTGTPLGLGLRDAEAVLKFEALDGKPWLIRTEQLSRMRMTGGNLVYLSSLTPSQVQEKPYVGGAPLVYPWRRDRAANGKVLTLGAQTYDRGLGVHSFSQLSFTLDGAYKKFLCSVGLDGSAPPGAVCAWAVKCDGQTKAQGEALAGAAPVAVKLDLAGTQALELLCDFGNAGDGAGSFLDWANARLIK